MIPNQKRPMTEKPEPTPPAQTALEAFMQSRDDTTGHGEDAEPLHIIPIVTAEGNLQGYYVPVPQAGGAPAEPERTGENFVTNAPAPTTSTVFATPSWSTAREDTIASLLSGLLLCVIALSTTAMVLSTTFARTTITITPQERRFSATIPLHLVTGVPTSLNQVEARRLPSLTFTQALSTQATGSYHQEPTYAVGYITLYNGQFSSVTVPGGTQFTGSGGVAIITTQTATIPGVDQSANPPAFGQVTVSARALHMGSRGNIQAYDIFGPCCATSVLVKNTQTFTGGQDAKTFTIVKQSDIDSLVAPLSASLTHSVTNALLGQADPGETVLLNPCIPALTPDHPAGSPAQRVTLTASETCSGLAYPSASVQSNLGKLVQADAPSTQFQLMKAPTVQILSTTPTPHPTITASVTALFVYRFTVRERQHLATALTGKTPEQASQVLHATPGVAKAVISAVPSTGILPSDTAHITIRFL